MDRADLYKLFSTWKAKQTQSVKYANTIGVIREAMAQAKLIDNPLDHTWISMTKVVSEYLNKRYPNFESQKAVYIALRVFAELVYGPAHPVFEFYKDMMSNRARQSVEKYTRQEMTLRESNLWLDWPDVLAKVDGYLKKLKLNELLTTTKPLSSREEMVLQDALILMIYTKLPPLRAEWRDVKRCAYDEANDNFVEAKNHRIVFNQYKTAWKHGENVIQLDSKRELWLLMAKVCELCTTSVHAKSIYLFHKRNGQPFSTRSNFGQRVYNLMKKVTGKKLGPNMLRKSFITHFLKQAPRKQLQDKIAKLQGHSVATQNLYRRFFQNFKDTDIETCCEELVATN